MRQTILTVILVLLLAAAGYLWIRSAKDALPPAPVQTAPNERLLQFQYLRNLKPDLGIFSDPLFRSLRETLPSPVAAPPPPGKRNPFNPL